MKSRKGVAQPAADGGSGALRVFRHRDYSLLVAGTMSTQLATWVQLVAQGWLIYQVTHSAFQLSLVGFVRGIVQICASPFSGEVADRLDRRWLLIIATVLGTTSGLTLALLVATHTIQIWQVYLTAALDGLEVSISLPVRQAMVYDVVDKEELTTAIAFNSLASNLARIIGPVFGGVLIGYVALSAAFLAQAGARIFDLSFALLLRAKPHVTQHAVPFFESVRIGLVYAVRRPIVFRLTLLVVLPNIIVWPYVQFMPIFAGQVLHIGAQGYGFLTTAIGYGSIIGGLLVAFLTNLPRRGLVTIGATLLYMALIALFALMHLFLLAFAVLVLAGVVNSIYITLNQTLLQLNVEDEYRGRVLALYATAGSLYPFGGLAMGKAISAFGPSAAVAGLCLLGIVLVSGVAIASPQVRRL
ncbi:MAG: MFS transporter [Dehalococcoidia bacterium]